MPTKYTNYPIYKYNEPATYDKFTGGINTDPSNEHLTETELRDCVNMTYLSGALVKRKGAKEIARFTCDDELNTIQGIFLFTYKITYVIIAADGKLYYGVFNKNTNIKVTRLYIYNRTYIKSRMFDETNPFEGIAEIENVLLEKKFDGYIQSFFTNTQTKEQIYKNYRGYWFDKIQTFQSDSTGKVIETISKGDTFEANLGLYLCIKDFIYNYVDIVNTNYWETINEWTTSTSYFVDDYVCKIEDNTVSTYRCIQDHNSGTFENETMYWELVHSNTLIEWKSPRYDTYNLYDVVSYTNNNTTIYKRCLEEHTNYQNIIYDDTHFVNLNSSSSIDYVEVQSLVFQNYRNVEAATFNNKLYIATGTRIIEIYFDSGELVAKPVEPYLCNMTEINKIGYNYMSPYPQLAIASQDNTVTTGITALKVVKNVTGDFTITPIMNIQSGDDISNYKFKWEKYINGEWYTIFPFSNGSYLLGNGHPFMLHTTNEAHQYLTVADADKYIYRCTFAKDFVNAGENLSIAEWSAESNYNAEDYVSYNGKIYKCIITHTADSTSYPTGDFSVKAFVNEEYIEVWKEVYEIQTVPFYELKNITDVSEWTSQGYSIGDYVVHNGKAYICTTEIDSNSPGVEFDTSKWRELETTVVSTGNDKYAFSVDKFTYIYDYVVDELGDYFGSATSVLFDNKLGIHDTFKTIQSCTKVFVDGDKLLFYNDAYNSGQWFKTIIKNPGYITDRGCLSFKTTKNEALIKIVAFQGNIIAFANSDNVGGSIHLVSGNGDDYDDGEGYYSPYQRSTINSSITCDNANTVQVCDNLLVFKHFNRIYYINASDLSNEIVRVTSCNDRLMSKSQDVEIPWEDNDCISEVTDSYYGLMWKEKFEIDSNTGELIQVRPAYRLKMYYKMSYELPDESVAMPWLRDESKYFNIDNVLYLKGKPIYLYNNLFISMDEDTYEDIGEVVETKVHFRAYDTNYPQLVKLLSNIQVYYHRNQFAVIDFEILTKNESGYVILDNTSNKYSIQDLRVLKESSKIINGEMRTGSTILDSKVFNPKRSFPYLLIDTTIKNKNKGEFSVSSITYNYTATDSPDSTMYDLYTNIIRPNEIS